MSLKHQIRSGPSEESSMARRRRSRTSGSTCSTTRSGERTFCATLCAGARQRGRAGRGRGDVRQIEAAGWRNWLSGWARNCARRRIGPAGAAGDDPKARRRRASARHPDDPGPGGADRREAGAGADLRGGSGTGRLRLSAETQRGRCDQGGAPACFARATPMWSTPI
jgi:hypothetical protein